MHRKEWLNSNQSKHTREMWGDLNPTKSRYLLKLQTMQTSKLVATITGRGPFGKHLAKLGEKETPLCACEEEEETPIHMITECPKYQISRWQIFGETFMKKQALPEINMSNVSLFFRRINRW